MKQYRKTATIELLETVPAGIKAGNGIRPDSDSVLVQNTGDSSDQWFIDKKIFEATYEPVEKADYTILTEYEREFLRGMFTGILIKLMGSVTTKFNSATHAAAVYADLQKRTGEEFKSFNDKVKFLESFHVHTYKLSE